MKTAEGDARRSDASGGDIAGATGTPDAIEASVTDRPRLHRAVDPAARNGRGVEWVRPTDLLVRSGSRVAGAGIDLQAELARHARQATTSSTRAMSLRAMSLRARGLPPVSAFGRQSGRHGLDRGAVGMS